MKIRWVDRVAFWGINHLLSSPVHQKFDVAEFTEFVGAWRGRHIREFYQVDRAKRGTGEAVRRLEKRAPPMHEVMEFPTPEPCAWKRNNHIWIHLHIAHPLDTAPMFFIGHGWRSVSVGGYHATCRRLNDLGVNAGILHLPYHFSRRPTGSFNGELAITSNVVRSAHAFRQAVQELCWLKEVFKELGVPHVGLWGPSYCAWISGLAMVVDEGFGGAVLLEPPVEVEELFWEVPLFSNLQKELNRRQITRENLHDLFTLVTPHHHPLKTDPSRVLILGAEHDPIGYPESLRRMHRAWPGTHLDILPIGHISHHLHEAALDRFTSLLLPKLRP